MERWKVNLYTIWFAQVIALTSMGFGLPFLPYYIQELGVTEPDRIKLYTGFLSAAPAITMGLMAPVWGILADKYGRKLMLLRSVFCAAIMLAAMGLVASAEQLIVIRLIQGLFTGTIAAALTLVASNTPNDKLSFALGFLSSSTFVGHSVGPVIGGFVGEYTGYRTSFFIGAALLILDFILVLLVVKEKLEIPMPLGEAPKTDTVEELNSDKSIHPKKNDSLVKIFNTLIVTMLVVVFFMRVSRTMFSPYLPLFVQETLSKMEGAAGITGTINGILGLVTAVSGLILGRLGDRYDKRKLLMIFIASSTITAIPLYFIGNLTVFVAAYALFYFAAGGIEPVIQSITSESTSAEKRGALFGIQTMIGSMGWALSPFLGSMISIRYSIRTTLLLVPVFFLMSLAAVYTLKFTCKTSKLS